MDGHWAYKSILGYFNVLKILLFVHRVKDRIKTSSTDDMKYFQSLIALHYFAFCKPRHVNDVSIGNIGRRNIQTVLGSDLNGEYAVAYICANSS